MEAEDVCKVNGHIYAGGSDYCRRCLKKKEEDIPEMRVPNFDFTVMQPNVTNVSGPVDLNYLYLVLSKRPRADFDFPGITNLTIKVEKLGKAFLQDQEPGAGFFAKAEVDLLIVDVLEKVLEMFLQRGIDPEAAFKHIIFPKGIITTVAEMDPDTKHQIFEAVNEPFSSDINFSPVTKDSYDGMKFSNGFIDDEEGHMQKTPDVRNPRTKLEIQEDMPSGILHYFGAMSFAKFKKAWNDVSIIRRDPRMLKEFKIWINDPEVQRIANTYFRVKAPEPLETDQSVILPWIDCTLSESAKEMIEWQEWGMDHLFGNALYETMFGFSRDEVRNHPGELKLYPFRPEECHPGENVIDPPDEEEGHSQYLKKSDQLKSFDNHEQV